MVCLVLLFLYFCVLLVILLFEMALKQSAEVLSSVPKHKKSVVCLRKKMPVLDKLPSSKKYGAVGYEFNVNEPAAYRK